MNKNIQQQTKKVNECDYCDKESIGSFETIKDFGENNMCEEHWEVFVNIPNKRKEIDKKRAQDMRIAMYGIRDVMLSILEPIYGKQN